MAKTAEQLEADVVQATAAGFRGRLLARGQARAVIWRRGILPPGAPEFSPFLTSDLHSYGYALLGAAFRLLEQNGNRDVIRRAFEQAAIALEATITNGDPDDTDKGFHRVLAGAAYHLGRFSARAYSVLSRGNDADYSPIERAVVDLILRNLNGLTNYVISERLHGAGRDSAIAIYINERLGGVNDDNPDVNGDGDSIASEAVARALEDSFLGALGSFLLAMERGELSLVERCLERLQIGLSICADLNMVPQWWAHKIAIHLVDDLWAASFHEVLPTLPQDGDGGNWNDLRSAFIRLLLRRERSEIDLWPSQIAAARRAVDQADDLVVSLPTSAGKTRIAELCILRCLAGGRRVVFVTPLRALSAQTEVILQRTFVPLGKTISALYGSIGASGFDEDAIRSRDIVVATPEKLDFAIRNDPSILDDVGLLIFDEDHMIGIAEREVRYEVQIQRLLRRPDAAERRIVCLSAILPDGDQLEDFTAWLRRDTPGHAVKSEWRPTGLHFGEVLWGNGEARLTLRVGDERPFIPGFLTARVPPIGQRVTPFPRDLGELCVATAWRLVEEGHSVLIFCPVRAHVEPFADRIIDLHRRGALASLFLADPALLETALTLGAEWLGPDHPILQCLRLGVAIHHGALPTAFRKEIERLLRSSVLKVTISSPTLAQGLNLSATTVIFHSLNRGQARIDVSEFKNVIGRAGRAYIDSRGWVLYPMYDRHATRLAQWEELIADARTREMESGLLRLVAALLGRMNASLGGPNIQQLIEYIVNNAEAWQFPQVAAESEARRDSANSRWNEHLTILDTAVLSLLGDADVPEEDIAVRLDEILNSSLWARRLARQQPQIRDALKAGLVSRARFIWRNSTAPRRKGYFLSGIGLQTGSALDAQAANLNQLLVTANSAILVGDDGIAIEALTAIAQAVFQIEPFIPESMPDNWQEILALWLRGELLSNALAHDQAEGLQFVEGGLVYRLSWALEAIRVRGVANDDRIGPENLPLTEFELGLAVAAVETGSLNRSATILMQAGFTSRIAAIRAVGSTSADFTNGQGLRVWLSSETVNQLTQAGNWPTVETAEIWATFKQNFVPELSSRWEQREYDVPVTWDGNPPAAGTPLRLYIDPAGGSSAILSDDAVKLGTLDVNARPQYNGLAQITAMADNTSVHLKYIGPNDLWTA